MPSQFLELERTHILYKQREETGMSKDLISRIFVSNCFYCIELRLNNRIQNLAEYLTKKRPRTRSVGALVRSDEAATYSTPEGVPLALRSLTAVFGMGTGGSSALLPPHQTRIKKDAGGPAGWQGAVVKDV